ncbi:MAG: polysaccharide biosynthesis tyrosine autokinase [Eubacterium sp.]|nr:polysaccharide biosynthesis tyrosine autokinase [Eubacterium sp.]
MAEYSSGQNTAPSAIDLGTIVDDVWKGFLRIWWLLLLIISIMASLFYVHVKIIYEPKYTAEATYLVTAASYYGYTESYYNETTASGLATSLEYVLNSTVMQKTIAEALDVQSVPGTIEVSVVEETNMITIKATAASAQVAYNILQAVIESYPTIAESVIGSTTLEVMSESGVPTEPSNEEWSKGAAKTGIVVGFIIDILLLFLYSLTKKTIRKEKDFSKILNVRCIAAVPHVRFKKRSKQASKSVEAVLMDNFRVPPGFVEAMRSVRRRIENHSLDTRDKVYLVTSALPEEGKSTVAANIALSLALKGEKVVIVDMDLRNPSLADSFVLDKVKCGTIDVLKERKQIEDALVRYKDTSLMILPGGKAISKTSRVLSSEKVEKMITTLKKEFDHVILDTPPCALLTDATMVAAQAEAAIFVVRQDFARVDKIYEGIENLAETGVDIMGCLLNGAEVGLTGAGYSKSYSYARYGYGHGDKRYGYGYGGYGMKEEGSDAEKNDK